MKDKLTEKQKMFCREYLIDLNATQAAIRAGYSKKTARSQSSQLLTKLNIQTYLKSLLEPKKEKLGITAEYVLNNIKEIGERCMQKVEITDHEGDGTGEYAFKENGALKAQELLGRHIKLFGEDAADSSRPIVVMPTIKVGNTEVSFDIGSEPDNS